MPLDMCPHGMNPISCPMCFNLQQAAPKPGAAPLPPKAQAARKKLIAPPDPPAPRATNPAAMREWGDKPLPPQRDFKQPHVEGSAPPTTDDKLWVPPAHDAVSENAPTHPEAPKGGK